MPEYSLSLRQTLQMRRSFMGKSCKLHFEGAPLKITWASRQYMYDDNGQEYLDCINNTSHVGHCHPHVVGVGQEQMAKLASSYGFLNDQTSLYAKHLVSTLPDSLCVCFFVSSGSEGNDLALRLARAYTKKQDVVCLDGAYHGNLDVLMEISPTRYRKNPNHQKKDWVHIAPTPNTFRGKYNTKSANPGAMYAEDVHKLLQKAKAAGRGVAAFISEPVISSSGMILPPKNYLTNVYRYVREHGGVCICDEIQSGLGRTGDNFWGFQYDGVVPDIVTIGKPIGNGYPLAAVVTTKEIAECLGDFSSTFGGNPVACAIGRAVLDVIENEKLMSSAKNVGKCLKEGFKAIQPLHPMIGDVRGLGMMVGVELVMDKETKKPAKEAADMLAYKMKDKKILVGIEGVEKNVVILLPPLCFTTDNARLVVQTFSEVLGAIESDAASIGPREENPSDHTMDISLDVITDRPPVINTDVSFGEEEDEDDEDNGSLPKKSRYDDLD